MRKITADWVYPINQDPIPEGVVIINEAGQIQQLDIRSNYDISELEIHKGVIIPGFVNTHCHLELSHMKGKVNTGTGLIPFITNVVQQRGASEATIQEAIAQADLEMYENGIVAVGDISNVIDTFSQKAVSKLRYYTFTEFFDFLQSSNAQVEFDKYKAVYDQLVLPTAHQKSCVPHAPYSVSPELFKLINAVNAGEKRTVSIHNQETPPENQLFLEKKGGFVDFYGGFGIALDGFEASQQPSINYALKYMDPNHRTLFVHNTLSTAADIQAAHAWGKEVYWATCPNANLYIENNLPNYQAFIDNDAQMTIGTDSLTSNWQLSILEELKTIAKYQSYVPFQTLLKWATLNGARALGFEDDLGSIEVGKSCGLNLLYDLNQKGELGKDTKVKRLV
ncbi:amidohydrolase family protein [Aureispira anguillae]|uniref:Amidohydrolase family protein n=1 Tax=Aureispira anguillae TaxID=2864201 RepID=A0A915YJI7_9BACT|nr:amidohydrolase family protein [Aureispira anguillae]BDS14179.1 amidohydrolase family protein [Aureispira anguillae]